MGKKASNPPPPGRALRPSPPPAPPPGEPQVRGEVRIGDGFWRPGDPPDSFSLMLVGRTEDERRRRLRSHLIEVIGLPPEAVDHGVEEPVALLRVACGRCGNAMEYRTLSEVPMREVVCSCGRCRLIAVSDGSTPGVLEEEERMATRREEIEGGCLSRVAEDEPVFVIRARDAIGPMVVRFWSDIAEGKGVDPAKVAGVRALADRMSDWQDANGSKVPD